MNAFIIVKTVEEAKDQLLRLGKRVTYLVDGEEYGDLGLIRLANSVVKRVSTRGTTVS